MLRFERKSRDREVSILLRSQDKVFNRLKVTALALALGIHLLGILLIQVAPIALPSVTTLLPPVAVKADVSLGGESVVFASIESEILSIKPPPRSLPSLGNYD